MIDRTQRTALIRLVILCAAWALGEALAWQVGVGALGIVLPAILTVAAWVATRDLGWSGGGGETYYRGRRIDRDRWR